jgi:hypothetical protein
MVRNLEGPQQCDRDRYWVFGRKESQRQILVSRPEDPVVWRAWTSLLGSFTGCVC